MMGQQHYLKKKKKKKKKGKMKLQSYHPCNDQPHFFPVPVNSTQALRLQNIDASNLFPIRIMNR